MVVEPVDLVPHSPLPEVTPNRPLDGQRHDRGGRVAQDRDPADYKGHVPQALHRAAAQVRGLPVPDRADGYDRHVQGVQEAPAEEGHVPRRADGDDAHHHEDDQPYAPDGLAPRPVVEPEGDAIAVGVPPLHGGAEL